MEHYEWLGLGQGITHRCLCVSQSRRMLDLVASMVSCPGCKVVPLDRTVSAQIVGNSAQVHR